MWYGFGQINTIKTPGHQLLYNQEDDDGGNVILHGYWITLSVEK